MLRQATLMGAFEATLEVRVSNHAAQSLYLKYGFERVGQRRGYYQDNGEDAWLMTVTDFNGEAYQARLCQLGQALRQRLWATWALDLNHTKRLWEYGTDAK
jgi:ribosomal-protein-alanine N-acetyltransferase